jgi:class 3 adenylate cyclase
MQRISLKSVLSKKTGALTLIASLSDIIDTAVTIKDDKNEIIFAKGEEKSDTEQIIEADGQVIGIVFGDKKAMAIAELVQQFAIKEAEKKKLGSEVLNLYQEINLIFNFSEKLAQTIDPQSISAITLEEANRIILSDRGTVLLWNESKTRLEVVATTDSSFFPEEKVNDTLEFFEKTIVNGQSEIVSDTSFLLPKELITAEVESVIYAALKVNQRVLGALILGSSDAVQYTAADLKMLTTLALQASAAIESALLFEKNIREAKEREEAMRAVYEVTGKFVPYEFIGSLGHTVLTEVRLGDQVEKIVTVLFCDIRDYTTLSEEMTPEENFQFVCSFNKRMGPLIRHHHGFINQYLGDAIMAIFPGSPADALEAAIKMHIAVRELNETRILENKMPIQIGIGMHTGPLIMGITGDNDRMDATTISDTVNTASRLESLTKYYKAGIILSETCLANLDKERYDLRYLGLVQLKGKHEAIQITECFSGNPNHILLKKAGTLNIFNEGIEYYLKSNFEAAINAFRTVAEENPDDLTSQFFLSKSISNLQDGVEKEWTGVVEMAMK